MAMHLPAVDDGDELGPWQLDAACRGEPVATFFPDNPDRVPPEVLALCSMCDVRHECLSHAIDHELYGIWGGMSEAAIDRLRRIRGIRIDRPEMDRGGVQRSVVDLHRCGLDAVEIALRLDTTTRSVYRHLEEAGFPVTPPDDWRRQPRIEETP